MKTKTMLTAAEVKRRWRRPRQRRRPRNSWAVTIAVVDDGGHLLHLQRMDGAAPMSSCIAPARRAPRRMGRRETRSVRGDDQRGRTAFLSAPLEGMLEGGVPIIVDGQVVGALGVSGVKSIEDAQIAKAGIAALG